MVDPEVIKQIQNLARQNPRVEICGLVTSSNEVIQLKNVSKTPERCFVFSKREYFTALNDLSKNNKTIQCVFHSHPSSSPEPSKADVEYVKMSKTNSLIVTSKEYRWIECQELTP